MTRRAPLIAGVVGVAVVGLIAVLAISPAGGGDNLDSGLVGHPAPALVGETMDGEVYDIDGSRGQWVLVNYFATWCPPCVTEHPELVAFSERNGSAVQVVSVAYDDTEVPAVERFFERNGGDWPVIVDGADGASLDWGVKKLPESFLVDPSGTVAVKLHGGVTAAQLEQLIADQQSERP